MPNHQSGHEGESGAGNRFLAITNNDQSNGMDSDNVLPVSVAHSSKDRLDDSLV